MGRARKRLLHPIKLFNSYCTTNSSGVGSKPGVACSVNCKASTDSGVSSTSVPFVILFTRLFLLPCSASEDARLDLGARHKD